jgi:hypothetical protein
MANHLYLHDQFLVFSFNVLGKLVNLKRIRFVNPIPSSSTKVLHHVYKLIFVFLRTDRSKPAWYAFALIYFLSFPPVPRLFFCSGRIIPTSVGFYLE